MGWYTKEDRQFEGDPRRCPRHGSRTSSPDGLFDVPCPECEFEADLALEREADEREFGRCGRCGGVVVWGAGPSCANGCIDADAEEVDW